MALIIRLLHIFQPRIHNFIRIVHKQGKRRREGGNPLGEREEGWGEVQLPPVVECVGESGVR